MSFFSIPTMFGSVIFLQLKLARAKGLHQTNAAGPGDQTLHPGSSTKNSSHQLLGKQAEKFRNQPTIFGFVVTSKTRSKKSRNNLESAGECYDGQPEAISVPHLFTACLRGLVFHVCGVFSGQAIALTLSTPICATVGAFRDEVASK